MENIKTQKLMEKEELAQSLGTALDMPYIMVTFHPVTLENNTAGEQFENLLSALEQYKEYHIIFTKANADTEGRVINQKIDQYVKQNISRASAYASLGMQRYLSTLKYCEMVIGNSSSGIMEAPSFQVPTVNIGNRQLGRIRAESVIDCENSIEDICMAIGKAKEIKEEGMLQNLKNPYERSGTSEKILSEMKKFCNRIK